MGEFHFSLYPERFWEEELLKMKAGGVQIVATYLFWIHHEEIEGRFDWSGQRGLLSFARNTVLMHSFVSDHGPTANAGMAAPRTGCSRNAPSPEATIHAIYPLSAVTSSTLEGS